MAFNIQIDFDKFASTSQLFNSSTPDGRAAPDSAFYEVKALKGGLLPPSYQQYQILGFIDALSNNPAKTAGKIPAIIFLTRADIKQISNATVAQASLRGVAVWHAIGG